MNFLKKSLIISITKFIDYIKAFVLETEKDIKFETNKTEIIKVMYNPLIEEKLIEKSRLLEELRKIRTERKLLNQQISNIMGETDSYNKKITALTAFQHFLLDNK